MNGLLNKARPRVQGLMPTYQIVKFEIPMHNGKSIVRQVVSHIFDDLVIIFVGSAQCFSRFDIFDHGLLSLDTTERAALTSVESVLLAVIRKPNLVKIECMKPCESLNGREPTGRGRLLSMGALGLRGYHYSRLSSIAS